MSDKFPPAPPKLRTEPKRLWQRVVRDFYPTPDKIEILRVATFSLNDFLNYREMVEEQGPVFITASGQIKKNPLVEIVKVSRMGFLAAMKDLGIDYSAEPSRKPGRPAIGLGVS